MEIFEYLPQLIVAYDGNDKFANLIHIAKADVDNNYFCPCCGGVVKPRALNSTKEQSHYYHITGQCTKESQLHFFCKNWLFDKGSKFYIEDNLFEVESVDVEKAWKTKFGDYKPDVTVHTTSGRTIYFEMFFTNRKMGDDYFCKWDELGNDVVEVEIKEYMMKTNTDEVPVFSYLYHDGVCYCKTYKKRDLYANTIAKIKRELTRQQVIDYKKRIEELDWFWMQVQANNNRDAILYSLSKMPYEDIMSCYEIIKKKQCMKYIKYDVVDMINRKVIEEVREELNLPFDENIYFDLEHVSGRTYAAGIRLSIETEHIIYDKLFFNYFTLRPEWFKRSKGFPKIVFSKNVFNKDEIIISDKDLKELQNYCEIASNMRIKLLTHEIRLRDLENDNYKVRMNNDYYTVLYKDSGNTELLFQNRHIVLSNDDCVKKTIESALLDKRNSEFLDELLQSNEYKEFIQYLREFDDFNLNAVISQSKENINFTVYTGTKCLFNQALEADMDDFNKRTIDCKTSIENFIRTYPMLLKYVNMINNCNNHFWSATLSFDNYKNTPVITIYQEYFRPKNYTTFEKVYFDNTDFMDEQTIVNELKIAMYKVLDNMQKCGYRVMGVCD